MTDKIPYLSKADLDDLPEGTVITAMDIPDSGTWWIATGDKDAIPVDTEGRRFMPLDDIKMTTYQQVLSHWIAENPAAPLIISTLSGRSVSTIHSMLDLADRPVTGRTGRVIIDDEIPPTSLSAWGDKLWPTDYADIELRMLAQMDNIDDWRKLYMCDWRDEMPEPTEKEKKQAHRETYLRHNKVRGKHRDPHARRLCPF